MRLSTRILSGFSIVLVLSIADTTSNFLLSLKVEQNIKFLDNSQDIIRSSRSINRTIVTMQSSVRGYLLTEDSTSLEDYRQGLKETPPLFKNQRNLVKDNREQLIILDSVEASYMQWIAVVNALIGSKNPNSFSDQPYNNISEVQLKKQAGKNLIDKILAGLATFDKAEYAIREVHSNNLQQSIRRTHVFSIIFFGLTIIIGLATTFYLVSLISNRINRMVNLAESISRGKFITVSDNQNDELTNLTTSLNTMSLNLQKNIMALEKRNAELDKFAYVVSHDLKAPIRGIYNVLQWIEEDLKDELSPQMHKYINVISGRTKRMENLINGLLDYARIREKTVPEHIDLNKLVAEIVEDIVPGYFVVEQQGLPVIFSERLKIEQVFSNLISNSVKYSEKEGAKIVIGCKEYKDYYEFFVKDNGIGIDPEFHERIFEMFQTLRERGEKESTGIGLSIIKKIIDEQQGQIRVNSQLGSGSEFIFTWPKANLLS